MIEFHSENNELSRSFLVIYERIFPRVKRTLRRPFYPLILALSFQITKSVSLIPELRWMLFTFRNLWNHQIFVLQSSPLMIFFDSDQTDKSETNQAYKSLNNLTVDRFSQFNLSLKEIFDQCIHAPLGSIIYDINQMLFSKLFVALLEEV